jgi:hypothetical protein
MMPESVLLAVFLVVFGAVIGILTDRRKFKYQTKSMVKTELLASIYRAVDALPALEMVIRSYRINEDQFGLLRHFADLINQCNSKVKALGVECESLSVEVQELITKMDLLGNRLLSCRKAATTDQLKAIADEVATIMAIAKNLADRLRSRFQKKKYLIF